MSETPLRQEAAAGYSVPAEIRETEFEKPRGIHRVEVRKGLARFHVSRLPDDLAAQRLMVLRAVADAGVSIDFLKFTPTGLSFVVQVPDSVTVEEALKSRQWHYTARCDRSVVLVHAVNMRDEVGLMAQIIAEALACDAELEHLGDMHDRLLIVVPEADADCLANRLQERLGGQP